MSPCLWSLSWLAALLIPLQGFQISREDSFSWTLSLKSDSTQEIVATLGKPLGLVLEEVVEGEAKGVIVAGLGEGSASSSEYKNLLTGCQLLLVEEKDVSQLGFDEIMSTIIDAPSIVTLTFKPKTLENAETKIETGTAVVITVLDGDTRSDIHAEVGDNLRAILLENSFEVYKGLKQKLGNCGGAGQCTFCAVDFIDSQGWDRRSDYEEAKLKTNANARLSCLNLIQGPATIRLS